MRLWFILFITCLMLYGCASSVGWGKKYEVTHSNSKSITIKYDSILSDFSDFSSIVDEHCKQYGKEAIPEGIKDSQFNTILGGVQTVTFRCE